MAAYGNMDSAIQGLKSGLDSQVETWAAGEAIDYGAPVFGYEGDSVNAYGAKTDTVALTLDADLVTDNTITFTINGEDVAVAFDTDHGTTMDNAVAAIEAAIDGISATLTDATDNRQITLFLKGSNLTATATVTGGGSQAGITGSSSSAQIFLGVALAVARSEVGSAGGYSSGEDVNVLVGGYIWVYASKAVNANTDVYVINAIGATQGQFTDSSSGYDCGCRFRGTISEAGLVLVEVNGQA